MRNMNIRKKLSIGFLIVAVATAIVGIIGIVGLYDLWNNETGLHTTAVNCLYAKELEGNLSKQRAYYNAGVLTVGTAGTVDGFIEQIQALDKDFLADVAFLESNILRPESRELAAQVRQTYSSSYVPKRDSLIDALRRRDEAAAKQLSESLAQNIDEIQTMTTILSDQGEEQMDLVTGRDSTAAKVLIAVMFAVAILSVVAAILLGNYISKMISGPVEALVNAARKLTLGDIDIKLEIESRDELGTLAEEFEKMIAGIHEQAGTLQALASGDYTVDIPVRSGSDVMNRALQQLIDSSNAVLREVASASSMVSASGEQISQGAQSLATGSTEQAASIEQFTVLMEQFRTQTEANASNAQKALNTTEQVGELIDTSTGYMEQMLEAMRGIRDSSASITRMNKVIEDIAFQTNILALNASVEAARAGQHGKGFAVVADEVRNLASKSSEAAQETATLIQGSTARVEQGDAIVQKTSASLQSVAEYSSQCLQLIKEIAEASTRQAGSMGEIQHDISSISDVVQQNSAASQESAAAAEEMAAQSNVLQQMVGRFRLKDLDGLQAGAPAFAGQAADNAFHSPAPPSSDKYSL